MSPYIPLVNVKEVLHRYYPLSLCFVSKEGVYHLVRSDL